MSTPPDLASLLNSWIIYLRAERKSPQTIKAYTAGVVQFLAFCQREGVEAELARGLVAAFTAELLDAGAEPATARNRQLAVRRFSAWLAEEGEITRDELVAMKPPKLDEKLTERLTDAQCTALIKACNGKKLADRRDEAMVRLLLETTMRAGELLALDLGDIDLTNGAAVVRRGKGGKGRVVPFGPQTGRAIDRYLRLRRLHRLAEECPALWLADRRARLSYAGLRKTLGLRAQAAGIEGFHVHLTRHTASQRWLAAGGSEGGLMAIAGWSRRDMLDRYTKATASERAAVEARGLNLGDL